MIHLPTDIVIYDIEKAIKSYRKLAQKNIQKVQQNITIDQALVLMLISNKPELTQIQIANALFKDYASITRMIELMVKNDYIIRIQNPEDRRRSNLTLSKKGDLVLANVLPVVAQNRKLALKGVSEEEQEFLKKILNKITQNCSIEKLSNQLISSK
tara:strand:+ start:3815 stop:4282 length:468 start_codon:yes stop_codon:yes gene_type:complete